MQEPEGSDTSDAQGGDAADNGSQPLTFDQNFKLMSAYRNLIRQRMIENRLDDRHDLEGNSLYILKFNSTVLGVPSVNERAIIQVKILPPKELGRLTSKNSDDLLESVNSQPDILKYARLNYNNWRRLA